MSMATKRPLHCVACGMPQYLRILTACEYCGGAVFSTSLPPASWDAALTYNDKRLLKAIGIKADT